MSRQIFETFVREHCFSSFKVILSHGSIAQNMFF
jgi:hypothetical protein